jgi:hypothetical protein
MNDSIYTITGDDNGFLDCGTIGFGRAIVRLDAELGGFYQTDSITGYFALGISYTRPKP